MSVKSFVMTSEALKGLPQRPIQSDNRVSKMPKGVVPQLSQQKPKVENLMLKRSAGMALLHGMFIRDPQS